MDILKFLALLLYIVQIFVNIFYGQNIGKISNTSNISNTFKLNISPSRWVFSIWLIIYSFQLYMLLNTETAQLMKIFVLHTVIVLFNVSWIFEFTNMKFRLTTFFIIGLIATLIFILFCEKVYLTSVIKCFYHLYFGWVTIASLLGVYTWLLADFNKYYNLVLPFILYSFTILDLTSYNLFIAIPYIIVYVDLALKKIINYIHILG